MKGTGRSLSGLRTTLLKAVMTSIIEPKKTQISTQGSSVGNELAVMMSIRDAAELREGRLAVVVGFRPQANFQAGQAMSIVRESSSQNKICVQLH